MNPPIRVLHLVRPAQGGIRRHVVHLIRFMDPALVSHAIAAPPDFLDAFSVPRHAPALLSIAISKSFSPLRDLAAAVRLVGALRRGHFDIVHAQGLRAAWIAALAYSIAPFPYIATLHNVPESGRAFGAASRLIGRSARCLIAVSPAVMRAYAQAAVPISVIPNGIPIAEYSGGVRDRRAWNLHEDRFVVACIARLSQEKGIDVLIAACRAAPDIQAVIAGDGPERATLARLAGSNIRFLGEFSQVADLLAVADVVAIPSRSEGQGIVALEAGAASRAIVASRVGGLGEMLTDEQTALLVPPDDPVSLASSLQRMKDNPGLRRRIAGEAHRMVTENYDVNTMVRHVEAVYRETVTPSSAT